MKAIFTMLSDEFYELIDKLNINHTIYTSDLFKKYIFKNKVTLL